MNIFHIDYEGYSRADLRKLGAYRYSEDPSTEITLCGVARNDEDVLLWDFSQDTEESEAAWYLIHEAATTECLIYAHNAPFEVAVSKYQWQKTFGCPPPALEKWRCTAAMGRRAALPHALAELGEVLKVAHQKDKRGESLINIFCKPRSAGKLKGQRILPTDEGVVTVQGEKMTIAAAWQLFREYCRRDVVAEREIHRKLTAFELKGTTLRGFQFDLRMNDRGLPVNLSALHKAARVVEDASKEDIARCKAICGFNPSQVTRLLPWLQERGYPGEDLQAETMDRVLESPAPGLPGAALEVLKIRARVSFSAVKKIPTMINAAGSDGRVRGTLMWSGAIRTHRWSGKIIQPQNFKRPTIKHTHWAYEDLKSGLNFENLGTLYGNPVEVVSSCIRHFIDSGEPILDADFSNIEARIVPWLAGQEDLLQAYRDGRDAYSELAAKIFDKPGAIPTVEECGARDITAYKARYKLITKDERFVGKQGVLLCGFQGGPEKLQATCEKYGQKVDLELCKTTVEVYREENAEIVGMWKLMHRAAINAIQNPGEMFSVKGKIRFAMATGLPFPALIMRLPSGHRLVYPFPRLKPVWIFQKQKYQSETMAERAYRLVKKAGLLEEDDRIWKTQQIIFFGIGENHQWGDQVTWGSKFFENAVQSISGDFMTHGMLKAEEAGYSIFLTVHDQALSSYRPEAGNTVEAFKAALCTLPQWALDFPLEATCDIAPWYTKD